MSPAPASGPVALLDAIVRDALDPSYAEAAARHEAEDRIRGSRRTARTSVIGALLLLGAGAVAGIAVSSEQQTLPQVGAARSALAGTAGESSKQVTALEQTVRARQREISALQQQQLAATADGRRLQAQAGVLNAAAGQTPVSGPGVEVTVSDDGVAAGATTDRELQDVVNALWAGGARAISVGGVRLGPQTAIRTAGQTILVGFHPLSGPYSIEAVGGPDLLAAAEQSPAVIALSKATAGIHPGLAITAATQVKLAAATPAKVGAAQPLPGGGHS